MGEEDGAQKVVDDGKEAPKRFSPLLRQVNAKIQFFVQKLKRILFS